MVKTKNREEKKRFTEVSKKYLKEKEKVSTSFEIFDKYDLGEKEEKHLPEVARNLSVIFGFFFVLLSAILGLLPYLISLQESVRILFYSLVWMFSLSMFFIGIQLYIYFIDMQIGSYGKHGFWLLVLIALTAYQGAVGLLIAGDILFFDISVSFIGSSTFVVIELVLVAFLILQTRKIEADFHRLDALLKAFDQEAEEFSGSVIELMKRIDNPEEMEEIIAFCTDVPKCFRNPSFQKEVVDAIIRFRKHKGIIEEVKRCPEFLDNYEIRHALREIAA